MLKFLKNSAIVLAITGTAMATTAVASADSFAVGINSDHGDRRGNVIAVGFGNVAIGYRDGYWDNGHRWHRWRNEREHRDYRSHYSSGYSDWNHDRDGNDGWRGGRNHH